jgi:hypothetical protein
MKFLCLRCDAAMRLERVDGPEEGSLTVIFACAACGNRIALLTNPGETQVVRALDVKVGGRTDPAGPMEFIRTMLAERREGALGESGEASSAPRCPFSAMANQAVGTPQPAWDPAAERRLERIPDLIRPMVRQGIERFAAERGYRRVTEDVMDEARRALGL